MTPQEQQLISGLIDRVQKTNLAEKDPDAEQMIQNGLGRNPDALYILAQTVLVQQFALDNAQHQLAEARAHQAQPKKSTSFLGSIFGTHDEPTQPAPSPAASGYQPVPGYSQPSAPPPPPYGQPSYGGQPYAPPAGAPQYAPATGSGGGFLRSALQTATGVAAGALAFQGIESLMHGFGSEGGSRGFGDVGSGNRPEEVVNNYYGDSSPGQGGFGSNDPSGSALSPDIEDRRFDDGGRDGGSQFAGADDTSLDDNDTGDTGQLDDTTGSDDDGSGDSFDSGMDDGSIDDSSTDDSSFS